MMGGDEQLGDVERTRWEQNEEERCVCFAAKRGKGRRLQPNQSKSSVAEIRIIMHW